MNIKSKLSILLFTIGFIIPNSLFAQYVQQGQKLVGTGGVGLSTQGNSVSISSDGNTAVVNGPADNGMGATWVFIRNSGVWTQQGPKLVGNGAVGNVDQGPVAISSDGNTFIVGGPDDNGGVGAFWVFTRTNGVWAQQGPKLVGTGGVGISYQGGSVSISSDGNTAIVGGWRDNNYTGATWVFIRNGGIWQQQGPKLVGSGGDGGSVQGSSVSISSDGNTLTEGGGLDNSGFGAIWVFVRNTGVWSQQGPKLLGTGAIGLPYLGFSVAISSDGNTIISGGYQDDNNVGAIWIFVRNGIVWSQQGPKLVGSGANGNAYEGWSVSISGDGNTAVLGGWKDISERGSVWVFIRSGGVWSQLAQKLVGTGGGQLSEQGYSVSISTDSHTIIWGGPGDSNYVGAAWVFVNQGIGIQPTSTEITNKFSLSQNFPNPFNPSTKIKFDIPFVGTGRDLSTTLKVYNMLGEEVTTLVNEQLNPGSYEVDFDGSNYSSGVYYYKITTGDYSATKKMVLIK